MGELLNVILISCIIVIAIVLVVIVLRRQMKKEVMNQMLKNHEHLEMNFLIGEIKEMMFQMTTKQFEHQLGSRETYERELNKRVELKKALKGCSNGSYEDKAYIIDYIGDLLKTYLIKEDEIDQVLYFSKPKFLSVKDKFDILIYDYYKKYGNKGLSTLIDEENWDREKPVEDEEMPVFVITKEEVEETFFDRRVSLSYQDKINIVAQRIYEQYKGFGVVDKIRDMAIDGVSGGVSGVIESDMMDNFSNIKDFTLYPRNYESVWIFYKGKSIHLPFLSFGSQRELKRVCQGIYRYNKAGQLSESNGYKVNEMKDGSRVVVVRPPFSESWAFFVRKFHLKNIELEDLLQDESASSLIDLLKFLMKGGRITAITGSQGSGKTTMLMALVRHIYPTLTLRIQEMAFELNLRKLYPRRNILTFKETDSISGQTGLDLQKKTDGAVNVLGEIATDEISVLMLQMAQVASLFTLFTHHGKTVEDLVLSLRNSLLKCNVFRDEQIAEEQVVKVLDFDIHLNKDYDGKRYIERITEIVPLNKTRGFNKEFQTSEADKMDAFLDTVLEYFEKRTVTKTYEERVIMYYEEGMYRIGKAITKTSVEQMLTMMTASDQQLFKEFLIRTWEDEYAYLYQYSEF